MNRRFDSLNLSRWMRFIIAGSLNFTITYLMYLGFMLFVHYEIAYLISYVLGIVIAYLLNACYVFRVPFDRKAVVQYPIIYIVQYVFSAVLLWLCVDFIEIPKTLAPLIVICAALPLTYIMNRKVLMR